MTAVQKDRQGQTLPEGSLKKRSQLLEIWDRLKTNKLAMVGMAIVLLLIVCAIFADWIAPYDINMQNPT